MDSRMTRSKTVPSPDLEGQFSALTTVHSKTAVANSDCIVCVSIGLMRGFLGNIKKRYPNYLIVLLCSPCGTGSKALCCKHSENPVWEKVS